MRWYNEELFDIHSSPNVKMMKKKHGLGEACGTYCREDRCIQCLDVET